MNALKDIILSICFAAVAIAVIEMLLPDGNFKAPMKLITGAVLIITILTPFASDIKLDFNDLKLFDDSGYYGSEVISNNMLESLKKSSAVAIKNSITDILNKNNIYSGKIKISMDTNEDSGIVINETIIFIATEEMDRADKLSKEIKSSLAIDVSIKELNINE